eukprot:g1500.t1
MTQTGAYSFSSGPRAVKQHRKKYRTEASYEEEDLLPEVGNIMYDPRVVRGSTVMSRAMSQEQQARAKELARIQRQREKQRRLVKQRKIEDARRASTPPPVGGRVHMDVQTDDYLEELTDRPPERDTSTQTDALLDRPPSPLFMPRKAGVDAETQIEEGDLFDFEMEVSPILEVLVGKTLEQSMDEVLEEEEIENIRAQRAKFEQMRNIELAEVQRLEAEARRKTEEKERRLQQERDRLRREEEVMQKIASRGFARKFYANLQQSVFDSLAEDGHFYDPVSREIETTFLPWLQDRASERVARLNLAGNLCEELIRAAVDLLPAKMDAANDQERKRIEELEAAAAAIADAEAKDAEGEEKDDTEDGE